MISVAEYSRKLHLNFLGGKYFFDTFKKWGFLIKRKAMG